MARAILVVGDTGDGKTSCVIDACKWVYEKWGLGTRMVVVDPSGYDVARGEGLEETGLLNVFDMRNRDHVLADFRRIAEGKWYCWGKAGPDGVRTKVFDDRPEMNTTPENWAKIGCLFFDSLTGLAMMYKNHIAANNTEGKGGDGKIGFKPSYNWVDGEHKTTGLQEGHIGMVQDELYRIISAMVTLPIPLIVFTARIMAGEEKITRDLRKRDSTIEPSMVVGPRTVGTALISEIQGWVGDCLHLERLTREEPRIGVNGEIVPTTVTGLVAWFRNHVGSSGAKYLAKTRISPSSLPELFKRYPNGYIPFGVKYPQGFATYLNLLEEFKEGGINQTKSWLEGLKKG